MFGLVVLNSACIEEEDDVIFPGPMLKALHSHGWVISSEQQVNSYFLLKLIQYAIATHAHRIL